MNEAARKARNEYAKKWRKQNPEKVKAIMERFWEKKAIEQGLANGLHKCLNCGKVFESKRTDAKFCSSNCKISYHRKDESKQ